MLENKIPIASVYNFTKRYFQKSPLSPLMTTSYIMSGDMGVLGGKEDFNSSLIIKKIMIVIMISP